MLHRLNNWILSLKTYRFLSPDVRIRRQINQLLRDRPSLSAHEWFETLCKPKGIHYAVAQFCYTYFQSYSGLEFSRVLLSDRLDEDLRWTQVCWFDWEMKLCNDFWQQFGIDLCDRLPGRSLSTVEELILLLNHSFLQHSSKH